MSYLPPSQAGFFEAIQVYFTEITGRMALFGARDRDLLNKWNDEGRSAQVVCRGIREAVASYGSDDPPRSLKRCEAFVDREWEKVRDNSVGSHEEDTSVRSAKKKSESPRRTKQTKQDESSGRGGLLEATEDVIREAGEGAEEERWRSAYREGWRVLKRVQREREEFSFSELEVVDTALVEAYVEALREEERQAIEKSLAEVSAGLARGMSSSARREHMQIKKKRALVERFGVLDLIKVLAG